MRLTILICCVLALTASAAKPNSIEACLNSIRTLLYHYDDVRVSLGKSVPLGSTAYEEMEAVIRWFESLGIKLSRAQWKVIFTNSFSHLDAVAKHCSEDLVVSEAYVYFDSSHPAFPYAKQWLNLISKMTKNAINAIRAIANGEWKTAAVAIATLYRGISEIEAQSKVVSIEKPNAALREPNFKAKICADVLESAKKPSPDMFPGIHLTGIYTVYSTMILNLGDIMMYCFRLNP